MAGMVRRLMEEWQTVHGKVSKSPRVVRPQRWSTLDEGWVKVNVDGARSNGGDKVVVGVVFRNNVRAFIGGACYYYPTGDDPEKMELQACKRAVELAEKFNIPSLHIEMDCKEVVRKLQSEEADLSVLGPMIKEVKNMLATRERWKVTWARRMVNGAAHGLAKEGVPNNLSKVWVHVPPDCILHTISAEIPDFHE
ncbi:uncharacterized protein [Aegilops tauschii subsp. strangulata]|uniref:uncharacterized protein n=1 Tax=Aegilops tauschii subsp. strangulata TaxID=200361 RepID=UPI00098B48B1|nr:uncharacterized protein LOC109736625 [Aegilops tauschii subsp. strangulata]